MHGRIRPTDGEGDPETERPRRRRAQSTVIGVLLLTAVVVVVGGAGVVILDNVAAQSGDGPTVDLHASATSQYITVEHAGGDPLPVADLEVMVVGEDRVVYPFSSFTQRRGSDATTFDRGDAWRRETTVAGDPLGIFLIHTPSNTIVDEETVSVELALSARFSYTPSAPTPLDSVAFDGRESTVEPGVSLTNYAWDFDDDGTTDATGDQTSYQFPDDGLYDVTLTVDSSDGRTASRTEQIQVYNVIPSASFTYSPTAPDVNEVVSFDGSSSTDPDGTITSYAWDFDDDGTTDATGATATKSFASGGNYTTRLTVTDDDGDTNRLGKVIQVAVPSAPSVTITATSITAQGGSGKYDVDVTFEATDADGDITNYTATLYDSSAKTVQLDQVTSGSYGGASTTVTLSDSDAQNGESPLYVEVRVGDSQSNVGTDSTSVAADNQDPTASFTYSPSDPEVGETITFDASGSSDPDGDSLTYEWDFDNDGTTDATGVSPTHSYGSSGTYTVELTVSDGNGGTATSTDTVTVGSADAPPSIDTFTVTDTSSTSGPSQYVQFDVDWAVSDDNSLASLDLTMTRVSTGNTVASASPSVSGASASGVTQLRWDSTQGSWKNDEYEITITVSDGAQSTTQSTTEPIG